MHFVLIGYSWRGTVGEGFGSSRRNRPVVCVSFRAWVLAPPERAAPASGDRYPRYDQDSGQANPVHSEEGLRALRRERKEDDQEDEGGGEDGHGCALAQAAGTLTPPRGEGCRRLGVSSGPDVI